MIAMSRQNKETNKNNNKQTNKKKNPKQALWSLREKEADA